MKMHTTLGAETLTAAMARYPHAKFLQMARDIAAQVAAGVDAAAANGASVIGGVSSATKDGENSGVGKAGAIRDALAIDERLTEASVAADGVIASVRGRAVAAAGGDPVLAVTDGIVAAKILVVAGNLGIGVRAIVRRDWDGRVAHARVGRFSVRRAAAGEEDAG